MMTKEHQHHRLRGGRRDRAGKPFAMDRINPSVVVACTEARRRVAASITGKVSKKAYTGLTAAEET